MKNIFFALFALSLSSMALAATWQPIGNDTTPSGTWSKIKCEPGTGWRICKPAPAGPVCSYVANNHFYASLNDISSCNSTGKARAESESGWFINGVRVADRHQNSITYNGMVYTKGAGKGQSAATICQPRSTITYRKYYYEVCETPQ